MVNAAGELLFKSTILFMTRPGVGSASRSHHVLKATEVYDLMLHPTRLHWEKSAL